MYNSRQKYNSNDTNNKIIEKQAKNKKIKKLINFDISTKKWTLKISYFKFLSDRTDFLL